MPDAGRIGYEVAWASPGLMRVTARRKLSPRSGRNEQPPRRTFEAYHTMCATRDKTSKLATGPQFPALALAGGHTQDGNWATLRPSREHEPRVTDAT